MIATLDELSVELHLRLRTNPLLRIGRSKEMAIIFSIDMDRLIDRSDRLSANLLRLRAEGYSYAEISRRLHVHQRKVERLGKSLIDA